MKTCLLVAVYTTSSLGGTVLKEFTAGVEDTPWWEGPEMLCAKLISVFEMENSHFFPFFFRGI